MQARMSKYLLFISMALAGSFNDLPAAPPTGSSTSLSNQACPFPNINAVQADYLAPRLKSDFAKDGAVDKDDAAIETYAVALGLDDPVYDINMDGAVNQLDLDKLMEVIGPYHMTYYDQLMNYFRSCALSVGSQTVQPILLVDNKLHPDLPKVTDIAPPTLQFLDTVFGFPNATLPDHYNSTFDPAVQVVNVVRNQAAHMNRAIEEINRSECIRHMDRNTGAFDAGGKNVGLAFVFKKGAYYDNTQTEVCLTNLGIYDSTGHRQGANIEPSIPGAYVLSGKYLETNTLALDNEFNRASSATNDFRYDYTGDIGDTSRESLAWSSEANLYYHINQYRTDFLNDTFINSLQIDAQKKKNLKFLQYRPDLVDNDPEYDLNFAKPRLNTFELTFQLFALAIVPVPNVMAVSFRSRHYYASLPPLSYAFDPEATVGDYVGLAANWITTTNTPFLSEAQANYPTNWQNNISPVINDSFSDWTAHRYLGNTEVYKYANYTSALWEDDVNVTCGGETKPACDKGKNLRNVMMFDAADASQNGVFPFSLPSNFQAGPTGSELGSLYLDAVFYDIAYEAGLGAYKTDQLYWQTISEIDNQNISMTVFGEKIMTAARKMFPSSTPNVSRYEEEIADVLTSRGIALYGQTNFRNNLPAAIGPVNPSGANNFGSAQPVSQPSVNNYGAYSANNALYTHAQSAPYMSYQFYRHSKYGPCDKLQLTNGTFDANGNYIPSATDPFLWEGKDRELGNLVVLAPSNSIRFRSYRARCANEKMGPYYEDVKPFGFRVIKATKNGFSFTVSRIGQTNQFVFSIVDPSLQTLGTATYAWTFTNSTGQEVTANGTSVNYLSEKEEPLKIKVIRTRGAQVDTLELRDRTKDLERSNGKAFVRNCLPGNNNTCQ